MSDIGVLLHGNDRLAAAIGQRLAKAGCRVVKLDLAGTEILMALKGDALTFRTRLRDGPVLHNTTEQLGKLLRASGVEWRTAVCEAVRETSSRL